METVKVGGKRLGRKRPEHPPHLNPKVLHFKDFVDPAFEALPGPSPLPPVRPYRDWMAWAVDQLGGAGNFGMMLNDQLGDCTCAAVGHMVQTLTAVDGKVVTPSDDDVLRMYEASGYVPGNSSTDQGWYIQDALDYWKNTGLAGHKIDTYVAIDPQNQIHIDLAFEIGGVINIGLGLPLASQNQNGVWYVPSTGLSGYGEPASWGGHSVMVAKRAVTSPKTPGTVLRHGLVTWGQAEWRITPNYWAAYVDEVWMPVSFDWIKNNGYSPSGFNLAGLIAAANNVQGATK